MLADAQAALSKRWNYPEISPTIDQILLNESAPDNGTSNSA